MQGKQPKRSDRARLKASHLGDTYTGFIPCKKHAKLINQGKITLNELINNRKEEIAFPNA